MTVLFQRQADQSVANEVSRRLPNRTNIVSPDGTVIRIPIDPRNPDAFTIISALQFVIEQYGRDPRVRATAVSILSSTANNDMARHIRDILEWVKRKMVYLPDPDGAEYVQSPLVLLKAIAAKGTAYGDCDDHVVLLGALLNSIGVAAEATGVKLHGAPNYNHVVIQYPWQGSMTVIDPCAKTTAAPFYGERLVVR